jgi:hypothetical protein
MGRMTLITGAERRRRWSDEDGARILAAISESTCIAGGWSHASPHMESLHSVGLVQWRVSDSLSSS